MSILYRSVLFTLAGCFACIGYADTESEPEVNADLPEGSAELEALKAELKKTQEKEKAASKMGQYEATSRWVSQMTREELRELRQKLVESDLQYKEGIPYRKSWAFKSGVTELNVPSYAGWVNAIGDPEIASQFSQQARPNERLAAILINRQAMLETDANYVNHFCLIWVPEHYAYSVFGDRSFGATKEKVKEVKIQRRKEVVDRDDFDSFEDYINFRFGKDDLMEDFANDYQMLANESSDHMTYFYTSEFIAQTEKEEIREPMVGTDTLALIRQKMIRFEIRMEYISTDDINEVLQFTETFVRDIRTVNGTRF